MTHSRLPGGPRDPEAAEVLDRLARQGAVDGGWIFPPLKPRRSLLVIALAVLIGAMRVVFYFAIAGAVLGLFYGALLATGVT